MAIIISNISATTVNLLHNTLKLEEKDSYIGFWKIQLFTGYNWIVK